MVFHSKFVHLYVGNELARAAKSDALVTCGVENMPEDRAGRPRQLGFDDGAGSVGGIALTLLDPRDEHVRRSFEP